MSGESWVSLIAITSGSYSSSKTAREARLATMLWLFRKISFRDSVPLEFDIEFGKEFWQESFSKESLNEVKICYQEH